MSRRSLGTLTIDVIAEIGGFASGLDKSERQAEKWRKNVEKQARAAGVALTGAMAAGVTGLVAGIAKVIANSSAAEQEIGQLDAILKSTGGAAGYTRQQLLDMADTLSSKSTFSGGEIVEAQTRLLSYSGVLGSNIPRAMQAIIDQSARLGISVSQSAETIGRALESPSKAAAALAQQGFGAAFTKEVRGTIDELVKAGREGEAQVMILEILEESYAGAAEAARGTFAGALKALQNALNDLTTAKEGGLESATEAVNTLIHTLNDPSTKQAFDNLISFAAETTGDFIRLTGSIADFISKTSEISKLNAGGAVRDASEGALDQKMARISKLLNAEKSSTSGFLGLPLTTSQEEARAKRINDLTAERLKIQRELTSRYQAAAIAENFKGVTSSVDSTAKDSSSVRSEAAAAAADAEGAKKRLAAQQQLQKAAAAAGLDLKRQIELFDSSTDKSGKATALQKLNFELADGALKGLNAAEQDRLRTLAATLDKLEAVKRATEEAAKAGEFARNAQASLDNARAALSVEFVGAGQGTQARQRAQDLLQIEADYQKQRQALFDQYQSGDVTETLYKKETETLRDALAERLRMQQEHYEKLDELRGNWQAGMSDAWADYATKAADANQQAYEAVTGFLDTTTGDVAESIADLVKGNESLSESVKNLVVSMGDTVIDTLSRMAAQWLVYQATQRLVGETTSQSSTAALTGNAVAMSAQAAIAAYASTAAIPITGPIAAPAAAAAALAATAPYVAAVAASSGLSGMAHDGIDAVPETGTWLLQKGERVTTASTSAKLDATLDRVNRDTGNGGGQGDQFHMNFEVNGSTSERERQMLDLTVRRAVSEAKSQISADMARGTGISRTMRATHNVGRKVR